MLTSVGRGGLVDTPQKMELGVCSFVGTEWKQNSMCLIKLLSGLTRTFPCSDCRKPTSEGPFWDFLNGPTTHDVRPLHQVSHIFGRSNGRLYGILIGTYYRTGSTLARGRSQQWRWESGELLHASGQALDVPLDVFREHLALAARLGLAHSDGSVDRSLHLLWRGCCQGFGPKDMAVRNSNGRLM